MSRYYTIVTQEMLNSPIPDSIKEYMGYNNTESIILTDGTIVEEQVEYTLSLCTFEIPRELISGDFVINIQLSNNTYIKNSCVKHNITENELAMAETIYGADNIITSLEGLTFKEGTIDI